MTENKQKFTLIGDIIQALTRSQKTLKMYPQNNPVYTKAIDDVFTRLNDFIVENGQLIFRFKQNEILVEDTVVYENKARQDNLALFFFRDGIREITFNAGLSREEIETFLTITAKDFDSQCLDDDMVTLLWEKNLKHIDYVATDEFILDEKYDANVDNSTKKTAERQADKSLEKAYQEAINTQQAMEGRNEIAILSEEDLDMLAKLKECEEFRSGLPMFIDILFEVILKSENSKSFEETAGFINETYKYCFRRAEFEHALYILESAKKTASSDYAQYVQKDFLKSIAISAGEIDVINEMGEVLDSEIPVSEDAFIKCARFMDSSAIAPMLDLLGKLQTMRARRLMIDVLAVLGKKDIVAITKGLKDSNWFAVRNTLYILGKINDKKSIEMLGECIRHQDTRVRKEAFSVLGSMGGSHILPHIKSGLSDPDPLPRMAAIKAFNGFESSDVAMRIILDEISTKEFVAKDYTEKREFFHVLAQWKKPEISDFLLKTLKHKTLLSRARNDEMRAAAAYGLSLMKNASAFISHIKKAESSGGQLLKDVATEALLRIKDSV